MCFVLLCFKRTPHRALCVAGATPCLPFRPNTDSDEGRNARLGATDCPSHASTAEMSASRSCSLPIQVFKKGTRDHARRTCHSLQPFAEQSTLPLSAHCYAPYACHHLTTMKTSPNAMSPSGEVALRLISWLTVQGGLRFCFCLNRLSPRQ